MNIMARRNLVEKVTEWTLPSEFVRCTTVRTYGSRGEMFFSERQNRIGHRLRNVNVSHITIHPFILILRDRNREPGASRRKCVTKSRATCATPTFMTYSQTLKKLIWGLSRLFFGIWSIRNTCGTKVKIIELGHQYRWSWVAVNFIFNFLYNALLVTIFSFSP